MAEKKVTMVIKVDLQCDRCYRKIKQVLCKFPEIRDQLYDDKQNRVIIAVVSCCPERILEKIARKGGKTVESIEIVPEKKPEGGKPEGGKPKDGEKKKEGDKGKEGEKKKEGDKPKEGEKKEGGGGGEKKEAQVHKLTVEPFVGYPTIYPSGMYYQPPQPYYQGYGAVPYYHGVPAYHGEGSYVVNRGYNMNHCNYYTEENPESCTVM